MVRRRFLASLVSLPWLVSSTAHAGEEELVVIVRNDNPTKSMQADDLRPLFQTKVRRWENGDRAFPLNLPLRDEPRTAFDRAVLGFSPAEAEDYWIDRRIRGGAPPPKTLKTPAAIVMAVLDRRGAIGYVPASIDTRQVKVVARIRGGSVERA